MAKQEVPEKQSKKPSVGGIVLLILLLLLIGTLGYLYYSVVKAPLDLDDPQKMAASAMKIFPLTKIGRMLIMRVQIASTAGGAAGQPAAERAHARPLEPV